MIMKDKKYMELAKELSTWSKDPSRKIGAIAVNSDGVILSQGYNGFPRGFDDSKENFDNREIKYKYIVHAEANLIYNAARVGASLKDSTIYVWGLPVCGECAKAIAQVGVSRVVWDTDLPIPEKWMESYKTTESILNSLGITIENRYNT